MDGAPGAYAAALDSRLRCTYEATAAAGLLRFAQAAQDGVKRMQAI